jgi:MYXO-CTERM domain-containing protein
MRKTKQVQAIACAVAALALTQTASANTLIYEPFDYTSGASINGQTNPGTGTQWFSVGSSPPHVVSSGNLSPTAGALAAGYPAPVGNQADLKKTGSGTSLSSSYDRLNIPGAFSGTTPVYAANSTLYYSVLLNVPSISGLTIVHSNANANNDGLIAFNNNQGSAASSPNTWNGELIIRLGADTSKFNLGIRASTTTPATTYFTGDLNPGQTYFIVVQATLGATPSDATQNTNAIWVDPNPATYGGEEANRPAPDGSSNGGDSTSTSSATSNAMTSIIIGAGIATAGAAPNDTNIDELRVGNTWADVTVAPEPGGLSLLGAGALGLLRRRRK